MQGDCTHFVGSQTTLKPKSREIGAVVRGLMYHRLMEGGSGPTGQISDPKIHQVWAGHCHKTSQLKGNKNINFESDTSV